MSLSSLTFVLLFLPLVLGVVFATPGRWRNGVLLSASLLFFAWGEPRFLLPLVGGCLFDYVLSRAFRDVRDPAAARRNNVLCGLGVTANVLALGYFKYAGFAIDGLRAFCDAAGLQVALPAIGVALPLGISFFTFQKISYLVDVHRGAVAPAPGFGRYLLYITLFPQLVMGPIIRYHEIADQFEGRSVTTEDFLQGLWRFAIGLARKTLVAGPLAGLSAAAFGVTDGGGALAPASAWIGLLAYTLQIYFDFAGYCDMAVGVGRMLGFRFPENFDAPYVSRDMAEFWRRWHITLGAFMKEYLYIPLGGNRCPRWRSLLNNWIVFLVSGIWHGAAWTFVVWGAWHGLWIILAKLRGRRRREPGAPWRPADVVAAAWTFLMVMLGWVFFASAHFHGAAAYFRSLFLCGGSSILASLTPQAASALVAGAILSVLPAFLPRTGIADWKLGRDASGAAVLARAAATTVLIVLAVLPLLTSGFTPFIYNRF